MIPEEHTWNEQLQDEQIIHDMNRSRKSLYSGIGFGIAGVILGIFSQRHRMLQLGSQIQSSQGISVAMIGIGSILVLKYVTTTPTRDTNAVWRSPTHSSAKAHDAGLEFEFRVLNKRFQFQERNMELSVRRSSFWFPRPIRELIKDIEIELARDKRADTLRMERELEATIRHELIDNKLPVKALLHKLNRRVFVVDFTDYAHTIPRDHELQQRDDKSEDFTSNEWIGIFRETCSFLIKVASPYDEVVIRLTTPGGSVSEYGLAASHIIRLRKAGIRVVACVDTICASGGYLMACCCNELIAAPFALMGSIGVVAELPNFSKVLKRFDVDYLLFTAGKFKRTVHPLAENKPEDLEKFQDQLNAIHETFQSHVREHRETINMDEVSTGETWLACDAPMGLVDRVMSSEEYLDQKEAASYDLIQVAVRPKKQKSKFVSMIYDHLLTQINQLASMPVFQARL